VQNKIVMAKFSITNYFKESYQEWTQKVSWPSWSELQNSAIVVSVASLIIAIVIYLMDISFSTVLDKFYSMFM
jgi:preprotein translocase subunit SecE